MLEHTISWDNQTREMVAMKRNIGTISLLLIMISTATIHAEKIYPPVDVLIDVGHGGVDTGTSYGRIYEKDINLAVGQLLYDQLSQAGYHVVLNRVSDYSLSDDNHWLHIQSRHKRDLAQRAGLAHELAPKIMISLHVNWINNPIERGPLVFYQKDNRSIFLARLLQESLNKIYDTSENPLRGGNLFLLNNTTCPTAIVEIGYISNPKDRELLVSTQHQKKLARTIKTAVDTYFLLIGSQD